MNESTLRSALGSGVPFRFFETTTSTNTDAKAFAEDGAPHGALVAASAQSAGRGRLGRAFASPPGGVYLSVVLRPNADFLKYQNLLTPAAAVAVCRAVQRVCNRQLLIKWVNDLFWNGKKCCGILAETKLSEGGAEYSVVGIGVDYQTPASAFPPELQGIAAPLYSENEPAPAPESLVAAIYTELLEIFPHLASREFLRDYRTRSMVLGKRVTVMANPPYEAVAMAIDDDARLLVQESDGRQAVLSASEISIKP